MSEDIIKVFETQSNGTKILFLLLIGFSLYIEIQWFLLPFRINKIKDMTFEETVYLKEISKKNKHIVELLDKQNRLLKQITKNMKILIERKKNDDV